MWFRKMLVIVQITFFNSRFKNQTNTIHYAPRCHSYVHSKANNTFPYFHRHQRNRNKANPEMNPKIMR